MNMKKWLATALACSALALTACGGQSNNASAPADKVYRVGSNAEFAPFESLDSAGKVEGFDVDLMNAMAKAGNFKVEFKHQPWESLFPSLNNGDVDIYLCGPPPMVNAVAMALRDRGITPAGFWYEKFIASQSAAA